MSYQQNCWMLRFGAPCICRPSHSLSLCSAYLPSIVPESANAVGGMDQISPKTRRYLSNPLI